MVVWVFVLNLIFKKYVIKNFFLVLILGFSLNTCQVKEKNIYSYIISSKASSKIIKQGNFEMNFTKQEWLAWDNQLMLEYFYDTIGNGKIDSAIWENTGYRKDTNHLYIHPPRSNGLEILEYAPFPIIYYDESKTVWQDTFTIPNNSGWGKDLDNSIFYQNYKVIKRNKKEIEISASSTRGKDISTISYIYDFKKGFQTMDFVVLDSLTVKIEKK